MSKKRFEVKQVAEALEKSKGFISQAAGILGCSGKTVQNYINGNDNLKQTVKEVREKRHDFVENMLMKGIGEGNTSLIIFYLKTQCHDRGYSEKVPETEPAKNNIEINFKHIKQDA